MCVCDPQKDVWFKGVIEKDYVADHVCEGRCKGTTLSRAPNPQALTPCLPSGDDQPRPAAWSGAYLSIAPSNNHVGSPPPTSTPSCVTTQPEQPRASTKARLPPACPVRETPDKLGPGYLVAQMGSHIA
jgi:hypothetical protein